MTSRFERLVTVYPPTRRTICPVLVWVMFPGFSGVSGLEWAISADQTRRHPESVFAGLPTDWLIACELPPREDLREFALWLLKWLKALKTGDGVVIGGLSLGGWVANQIYRIAQDLPTGERPEHLGLTMVSTPATPHQLRPVIRLLAKIGQHTGFIFRTRAFQATFIRPKERKRIVRILGPDVLELIQDSVKVSSVWWARTLREVTQMDGLGQPLDPSGEVFSVNLEKPGDDDVLLLQAALDAIEHAYPGIENISVRGLTRHGTLMQDGQRYHEPFELLHDQYVDNWGLTA